MKASRAARLEDKDPANDPPPIMHHVMSNAVIDSVGADSARHRCYWMTVSGGPKLNSFHVAAEGRYEDELVKRGGKWLIHRRKIVE
jgi:3-phenylpropionate/cinnamic acid dioxygenase small subunit